MAFSSRSLIGYSCLYFAVYCFFWNFKHQMNIYARVSMSVCCSCNLGAHCIWMCPTKKMRTILRKCGRKTSWWSTANTSITGYQKWKKRVTNTLKFGMDSIILFRLWNLCIKNQIFKTDIRLILFLKGVCTHFRCRRKFNVVSFLVKRYSWF